MTSYEIARSAQEAAQTGAGGPERRQTRTGLFSLPQGLRPCVLRDAWRTALRFELYAQAEKPPQPPLLGDAP